MKFTWDEAKNAINAKRHGIDFVDAKRIFSGYILTLVDDRIEYGEERYVSFGLMYGRVIAVVHTESEEEIRIISARKATQNEQKEYFRKIAY
ncbi:MAG: BrnT family toxin [Desulfobacterales bacterium]